MDVVTTKNNGVDSNDLFFFLCLDSPFLVNIPNVWPGIEKKRFPPKLMTEYIISLQLMVCTICSHNFVFNILSFENCF